MKWLEGLMRLVAPMALVVGAMALGLAVECRVGGVQVVAVDHPAAATLFASSSNNPPLAALCPGPDR